MTDTIVRIPVLTTERLTLRAPSAGDVALYTSFFADPKGSEDFDGPKRADEAFRELAADLGHWQLKGFGPWVVVVRETGEAVGICGLEHSDGWPGAELVWWLIPGARSKGYATEAARAAVVFGYDVLGWPVVETHMRDDNLPGRRLAKRLGGKVVRREWFPDGIDRDVFELPRDGAQPGAQPGEGAAQA